MFPWQLNVILSVETTEWENKNIFYITDVEH